ncbi:hypothetical protein EDB19DRAFT_1913190 [Suillus lakei]|nr:hypothetical protein EDB19DRAFT_1913190 [Suillus lakei]
MLLLLLSILACVTISRPRELSLARPRQSKLDQLDDVTWGQQDDNSQTTLGWNGSVLGWGQDGGDQPMSDAPEAHMDLDSLFPIPKPHSGQKRGEAWQAFFARCHDENKKKEETETPAQRQSCQSHEWAAMNHSIPGRSSMVVVFEWQPDDEFDSFHQHVRLMKAELPMTWMSYNKSTRVYDSFRNEWDLCDALDPTSIPDGDWEEDNFLSTPPSEPSNPTPAPPPPPLSSFLQDINTYFGGYKVAPSAQYTSGVERFVSVLHFHLGYQLATSTTTP